MAYKISLIIFFISVLTFMPSFAETTMNGTIFGTNTVTIQITSPITVGGIENDGIGISTTPILDGNGVREYTFDRINSNNTYSVYWTGISSSEIDFTVATLGLTDVRTTTTGSILGSVHIDSQNTPFSFTNNLNTILVNTGKAIQEFFFQGSGGNSGGTGGSGQVVIPTTNPNQSFMLNLTSIDVQGLPGTSIDSSMKFSWNTPDGVTITKVSFLSNSLFNLRTQSPATFNYVTPSLSTQSLPVSVDIPSLCSQSDLNCINYGSYSVPILVTFQARNMTFTGTTNVNVNVVNSLNSQSSTDYTYLLYGIGLALVGMIVLYFIITRKKTDKKRRYNGASRILKDVSKYEDYYKNFGKKKYKYK